MTDMTLADIPALVVAVLCLDFWSGTPLGFSLLPVAVVVVSLQVLRAQIYLQTAGARLIWASIGILLYQVTTIGLRMMRGEAAMTVSSGLGWMGIQVVVAAGLAVLLMSPLQRYLTVTWDELRRPRGIVVP